MNTSLEPRAVYLVRLCNGEVRRWQYLRTDALERSVWRDMETGGEFSETSLLYVWEIVGREIP